jgi:hypothetical protein
MPAHEAQDIPISMHCVKRRFKTTGAWALLFDDPVDLQQQDREGWR